MKKSSLILMMFITITQLSMGDIWSDFAQYKYGDDPNAADAVDKLMQSTPVSEHCAIEDKLIQVISSKDSTVTAKQFSCRMLQQIGTEKCVPAVAALLNNEDLAHYARLVLERMETSDKAIDALQKALCAVPEKNKTGIIGSLAELNCAKALPEINKSTTSKDQNVAKESLVAMGKIGGNDATKYIESAKVSDNLKYIQTRALVASADKLAASGKKSDAKDIYKKVYTDESVSNPTRAAALKGLVHVDPERTGSILVELIKGNNKFLKGVALRQLATGKCPEISKVVCKSLGAMDQEEQLQVITVLEQSGYKPAVKILRTFVSSENANIRKEAIAAVAILGSDKDVLLLLEQIKSNRSKHDSLNAIARMTAVGTDKVLVEALDSKSLQNAALQAIAARRYAGASEKVIELAKANAGTKGVWPAIGATCNEKNIASIMQILSKQENENILASGGRAIRDITARAQKKDPISDLICKYYETGKDPIKIFIIECAPVFRTKQALKIVETGLKSDNKKIYDKALRSLAGWQTQYAAPDLLELSKGAKDELSRILSLRGYIHLAGVNRNEKQKLSMYKTAATLASRTEEKLLIIAGLNMNARNLDTKLTCIDMLLDYIDDPTLSRAAEQAIQENCKHIRKTDKGVQDMAEKLMKSQNKEIAKQGKSLLK